MGNGRAGHDLCECREADGGGPGNSACNGGHGECGSHNDGRDIGDRGIHDYASCAYDYELESGIGEGRIGGFHANDQWHELRIRSGSEMGNDRAGHDLCERREADGGGTGNSACKRGYGERDGHNDGQHIRGRGIHHHTRHLNNGQRLSAHLCRELNRRCEMLGEQ